MKNKKEMMEKELEIIKRAMAYSNREWGRYKQMYMKMGKSERKICEIACNTDERLFHQIVEETLDDNHKVTNIIREE